MKQEKKPETNEEKTKSSVWKKLGDGCLEAVLELVLALVIFGIGAGILSLLGRTDLLEQWDSDTVILIGILALFVVVGIVGPVIAILWKKKK